MTIDHAVSRRHFLTESGLGIGTLALSTLLGKAAQAAPTDLPHFAPKARSVIFLFMAGAPSQLDLFDPKPGLLRRNGQKVPEDLIKGERFAFIQGQPTLLGSPYRFSRHGQSGAQISELLPHLGSVADDVSFVRTVHTTQFNHGPGQIFLNTGHQMIGRPSMGSWVTYGLGSDSRDLPGFVVLLSGESQPDGGKSCWGSGFLPTVHQGVEFRSQGDPVLFLSNPDGLSPQARRDGLDTLGQLNRRRLETVGDPEIATRIAAYELACRMQTSVPDLVALDREPAEVHRLYGTEPGRGSFANNCLLARRLVERGTRFVQLYHRGWDHHGNKEGRDLTTGLPRLCRETDQAATALIRDLKRRGLLETTLVVWGGEFGRTPMNQQPPGSTLLGRDHHARAFTMWLAGGGIKPGITLGTTDELGYHPTEDPVSVHDLHATMIHLLGLDPDRLTYPFQGRDYQLTDLPGKGQVVRKLLG